MAVPAIRGWTVFCMGAWLMGTVCTAVVATQNFYTIDRLLAAEPNPAFTAVVDNEMELETIEPVHARFAALGTPGKDFVRVDTAVAADLQGG